MSISINDYWHEVIHAKAKNPNWRFGQTAFNVLYQVRPDLSERVRGTDIDPFHCRVSTATNSSERIKKFREFLNTNW